MPDIGVCRLTDNLLFLAHDFPRISHWSACFFPIFSAASVCQPAKQNLSPIHNNESSILRRIRIHCLMAKFFFSSYLVHFRQKNGETLSCHHRLATNLEKLPLSDAKHQKPKKKKRYEKKERRQIKENKICSNHLCSFSYFNIMQCDETLFGIV